MGMNYLTSDLHPIRQGVGNSKLYFVGRRLVNYVPILSLHGSNRLPL